MLLKTLVLALSTLLGGTPAGVPRAEVPAAREFAPVCPEDNAGLRERVLRLIQSPAAQPFRQRDGWAGVTAANLQVLTDASHASVCEWLRTNVTFRTPDRITGYYVADGYYFVATERIRIQRPGTMLIGGWEPVIVIRNDLTFVGSYAS
jgi:hypothetical protein